MAVDIADNSDEIRALLREATQRALERCGLEAEGFAKDLVPVNTGNLRNSISHQTDDDTAYVGTHNEYAIYVELGTGKYATGGGRQDPWVYQDAQGNWHHTHGQRAQPYLKPAMADNADVYRNIIKDELGNA